jgi:hypothetical protein
VTTPHPYRNRITPQVPSQRTARPGTTATLRAVPASRPAAHEQHPRDQSQVPGQDPAGNKPSPITAVNPEARNANGLIEWDFSALDPEELEHPWTAYAAPEWPDPSWPGFRPGAEETAWVLAVSPWYLERYGDKAYDLGDVFHPGKERYRNPEPDLEAEP